MPLDHDQLSANWPDEGGPWRLTFRWQEIGSRTEIVGLSVEQTDAQAPEPITARSLREIPINRVFNQLIAYSKTLHADYPEQTYDGDWTPTVTLELPRRGGRAEGPAAARQEKLGMVARVYDIARLDKRRPTKAVAEHFGVPRSTAANWVQACRKRGLLGPATGPRVAP